MSSPPAPLHLTLPNPKKRPSVSQNPSNNASSPTANPAKRRKPSSATSSTHPLRQTSFPPTEHALASTSRLSSYSPVVDDGASAVSSSVGRGSGKGRGKKSKGTDARSATGASTTASGTGGRGDRQRGGTAANGEPSVVDGEQDGAEDDEDDEDMDEGIAEEPTTDADKEHRSLLLAHMTAEQEHRYEQARHVKLKKETVRKLVNQTLSQSVPNPIVLTVMSFAKMLVMELVEGARDVQSEWLAASPYLPNGEPNPDYALRPKPRSNPSKSKPTSTTSNTQSSNGVKEEPTSPPSAMDVDVDSPGQAGAVKEPIEWVRPKERDKGPLTPDHLREALRRYKKDLQGGGAGFQGLSLQGVAYEARRAGGKRLFR